jgi:hypothetical protein
MKLAFLGGAALSVLSISAHADELSDLKAQIEALNARVSQMEAAPQVPAGYSLLSIAETARVETPGLEMRTREQKALGDTATMISVLPTADAPATTTITWSGYTRAALVYSDSDGDVNVRGRYWIDAPGTADDFASDWGGVWTKKSTVTPEYVDENGNHIVYVNPYQNVAIPYSSDAANPNYTPQYPVSDGSKEGILASMDGGISSTADLLDAYGFSPLGGSYGDNDWDVKARGEIRVTASTDTAVGEVGVDIKVRADFDGVGSGDAYFKQAWGYWAMTPELTLGGGYAGSLGNVGYGYDGACTCYYTDNADMAFNPGDTTQLRLSYASGPFSMGVALEDASVNTGLYGDNGNINYNGDALGVAGEVKYSGDMFSGEISGVWRKVNDDTAWINQNLDDIWQVGAGVGFSLGDVVALSIGAALGSGPYYETNEGNVVNAAPIDNDWWGVSALASFNMTDAWHAEVGAGYKNRESDSFNVSALYGTLPGLPVAVGPLSWSSSGVDWDQWAILGGIYYDPVPQLTLGLEAEWYSTDEQYSLSNVTQFGTGDEATLVGADIDVDNSVDNWSVDFVAVWRF